jgi:hypothetical protein
MLKLSFSLSCTILTYHNPCQHSHIADLRIKEKLPCLRLEEQFPHLFRMLFWCGIQKQQMALSFSFDMETSISQNHWSLVQQRLLAMLGDGQAR